MYSGGENDISMETKVVMGESEKINLGADVHSEEGKRN